MEEKFSIRDQIWPKLREVAIPDSRFNYDFNEFITDFIDSNKASDNLINHCLFKQALKQGTIFITPDNCLYDLRVYMLLNGHKFLITTYGIRRGFLIIDPTKIPQDEIKFAASLDGMEKWGQYINLVDIKDQFISMMITGLGAINYEGVRIGKGHGYFDLEWSMLYKMQAVEPSKTICVGLLHDVQLVNVKVNVDVFDTVCDLIITNTQVIETKGLGKPTCGIVWDLLQSNMLEDIPPLRELYNLEH